MEKVFLTAFNKQIKMNSSARKIAPKQVISEPSFRIASPVSPKSKIYVSTVTKKLDLYGPEGP